MTNKHQINKAIKLNDQWIIKNWTKVIDDALNRQERPCCLDVAQVLY